MKTTFHNCLLNISGFMALLSTYCKFMVSKLDILNKSNIQIIILFFVGIVLSYLTLFLLHYLFRRN